MLVHLFKAVKIILKSSSQTVRLSISIELLALINHLVWFGRCFEFEPLYQN